MPQSSAAGGGGPGHGRASLRDMSLRAIVLIAATATGTLACSTVQDSKPAAPAIPAAPPALPPGMTQEETDAYAAGATPGEMHAWLAGNAGTWTGVSRNWSAPDTEPMSSDTTLVATMELGGRYLHNSVSAEWPGIGPFDGRGTIGYDNSQRMFVATWCDNMGTGIMTGSGQLAADRKTLTITYTFFDPASRKPTTMRETMVRETDDRIWVRLWMTNPKTGADFLMMETTYTRKAKAGAPAWKRPLNDNRGDRD